MFDHERTFAQSLARYEAERKEVPDPHHLGEIRMLISSRQHPNLSPQGRETTARRIDFLIGLLQTHQKAEFSH